MIARIATLLFLLIGACSYAGNDNEASKAANENQASKDVAEYEASKDAYDYEALKDKYYADHPGKGKYADLWEPIPIQQYWNPVSFYEPPNTVEGSFTAEECIACHQTTSPGWVHAWSDSSHANLDEIRNLDEGDPRFYKKAKLETIEKELQSRGVLAADEQLESVSCIDCHAGVGKTSMDHQTELKLPDRAMCGACHVQEFVEA